MRLRPGILVLGALTLVFCVLLAFNLAPGLRGVVPWLPGDQGWEWLYRLPRPLWFAFSGLGVLSYVIGAVYCVGKGPGAAYPVRLVLWAYTGAAILPILATNLEGPAFAVYVQRILSRVMGAYPLAAVRISDLADTLRAWPAFTAAYQATTSVPPGGVVLDPPGLTIMYRAVMNLLSASPDLAALLSAPVRGEVCQNFELVRWTDPQMASVWLQVLMPLWAALAVAPLYTLGRQVFDPKTARWAIVIYPLVPGLALFSPRFNTLYPLITLVMLTFLWRGLVRGSASSLLVAGLVLSGGTFLNISLVPLGLLAGFVILVEGTIHRRSLGALVKDGAWFGAGAAGVWVVYALATGVAPWSILAASMGQHLRMDRPYLPWLVMHPYDMFLFAGIPVAVLAIGRLIAARHIVCQGDRFALASGLSLLILILSGTARGETGRVWLFLAPLWVLFAADWLQRWTHSERALALGLQGLTVLVMAAFIQPYLSGLTLPATPVLEQAPPTYTYNTHFEHETDRLTLLGVSLDPGPSKVTLQLHWRADAPIRGAYAMSLARVMPDGRIMEGLTWVPYAGDYPPSCWVPGEAFVETYEVPLMSWPQPGNWQFSLSIVDVFSSEPMAVTNVDGTRSNHVGIGPMQVPAD